MPKDLMQVIITYNYPQLLFILNDDSYGRLDFKKKCKNGGIGYVLE